MKAAVEIEYRRFFIYPDYSLFFILDKKQKREYYFLKAASAGSNRSTQKS
jgi:hypothetical protein